MSDLHNGASSPPEMEEHPDRTEPAQGPDQQIPQDAQDPAVVQETVDTQEPATEQGLESVQEPESVQDVTDSQGQADAPAQAAEMDQTVAQGREAPEFQSGHDEDPDGLQRWEKLLVDVGLKNMNELQRAMVKDLLVRAWHVAIREERRREREAATGADNRRTELKAEEQEGGGTLYRFSPMSRNIMVPVDSNRGTRNPLEATDEERAAYERAMAEGRARFKAKEGSAQRLDSVAKEKV